MPCIPGTKKISLKLPTQYRPTSTRTFCQAHTSYNGLCSITLRILIAIECSFSSTFPYPKQKLHIDPFKSSFFAS